MSNILLAYNNRADAASFAAGSWVASGGVALSNLGTKDLGELARSSSAAVTATRFRFDLTASRSLRALNLTNHNLSAAATVRQRLGRAVFDVDWASYIAEDRATFAGGAGGTRVTSAGLVASASTPVINHSPVTLAVLGLLVLAQRTNLLTYSREFDNAAWTTDNVTVTPNATTSPTGSVDADAMFEAATTSTHSLYSGAKSIAAGDTVTETFTVKPNGRNFCAIQVVNSGFSSGFKAEFTLTGAGAVSAFLAFGSGTYIGASIQAAANGFYSCTVTGIVDGVSTSARTQLLAQSAVGTSTYLGDIAKGLYLHDSDLVVSPFAITPIPTTSAAVTRTADSITVTSSSFTGIHSATAGTLYAEFNLLAATGTQPIVSLDDNTANERIEMYVSGTDLKFKVVDGGATQCDITIGTVAAGTFYKAAVAWQANDFTGCLSGTLAASPDTSGTLPTVDRMRIGSDQAGNVQNGHQKRTARFLERLTNAELQTITASGIDALGYDSGWVNALRFSFIGDTPTNWGEQYPVMFAFDAITARYGTLEINDTANAAGYVQAGRLFVGGGFQPTNNAEYGRQRGRTDLSSSVKSISGKKYSTARRRPRTVDMRFPVLSAAEANHLDEMADAVGTTEEVFYVPDPADMELSQRQGFLAHMRELGALEDSFYENVATPYRLEEKL